LLFTNLVSKDHQAASSERCPKIVIKVERTFMENDPLRRFVVGVWMDQLVERTGDTPLYFYGEVMGRHIADTRSFKCAYRTVIYRTKTMDMQYVIGSEFTSELNPTRFHWADVSPDLNGLQPKYMGWLVTLAGAGLVPVGQWQDFREELSMAFKVSVAGAYKDACLSI